MPPNPVEHMQANGYSQAEIRETLQMKANEYQVGGNHYRGKAMQPWDVIEAWDLDFWEGNAIKYVLRRKGERITDLRKAIHYLEKKIELLGKEQPVVPGTDDRGLLEKVAKAIGLPPLSYRNGMLGYGDGEAWVAWNPLTSDADCLQMVTLLPRWEREANSFWLEALTGHVLISEEDSAKLRRHLVERAATSER